MWIFIHFIIHEVVHECKSDGSVWAVTRVSCLERTDSKKSERGETYFVGTTAVTSISTRAASSISATTCTAVIAG